MAAAALRCGGLVDADRAALAGAVAYYRTVARPLELGQALEDLAVAHAAGGDVAAARAALRGAVEIYTGLAAEGDILRAHAPPRPSGGRRRRAGAPPPVTGGAAPAPAPANVAHPSGPR